MSNQDNPRPHYHQRLLHLDKSIFAGSHNDYARGAYAKIFNDTYFYCLDSERNGRIRNLSNVFGRTITENSRLFKNDVSATYIMNAIYAAHLDTRRSQPGDETVLRTAQILKEVVSEAPSKRYDPYMAKDILSELKADDWKSRSYTSSLGGVLNAYAVAGFIQADQIKPLYKNVSTASTRSSLKTDMYNRLHKLSVVIPHGFLSNADEITDHFGKLHELVQNFKPAKSSRPSQKPFYQ